MVKNNRQNKENRSVVDCTLDIVIQLVLIIICIYTIMHLVLIIISIIHIYALPKHMACHC